MDPNAAYGHSVGIWNVSEHPFSFNIFPLFLVYYIVLQMYFYTQYNSFDICLHMSWVVNPLRNAANIILLPTVFLKNVFT